MEKRTWLFALLLLAAACSSSGKGSAPNASASVNATTSLVGHGTAKQNVRADLAFVIVEPGSDAPVLIGPPGSSGGATPKQRSEVRARMGRLGIASSAVHFDSDAFSLGGTPSTSVRVEVPVARLKGLASKVAAAITGVIASDMTSGLRFAVSDCTAALSTARTAAMADARRHAASLARAAHVTLGELRAVSEGPSNSISAAYLSALGSGEPCGRSSALPSSLLSGYGSGNGLLPLDAKPEVELSFSVSASYALGEPADRTMTATGTGEIEANADRADILLAASIDGGFVNTPQKLTAKDRARVVSAVRAFGVSEGDIEVETQGGDVLSYVRVHLPITRFRASGTKIVDAVQKVIGDQAQAGVFFTASNCDALVARARDKAVTDAGRRLARLARAANLRVGRIVGLDEPSIDAIAPQLDSCHPDFSSFDSAGGLIGLVLNGGSALGGLSLQPLDAEARVSERVSVSETRAITG